MTAPLPVREVARRWWDAWKWRGLPRCNAWFGERCPGVIWPWQEAVGPEELRHAECARKHAEWLGRFEAENP